LKQINGNTTFTASKNDCYIAFMCPPPQTC
jgi:hypothetical protein